LPAAVLLVSRRPTLLAPLADACAAAHLDVDVGDDAAHAVAVVAARDGASGGFVGVVVELGAVGDDVERLCSGVRALPGLGDVPIALIGPPGGPLATTNAAVAVGADAFFALPIEARRVVAKLLAYGGVAADGLAAIDAVLPLAEDEPVRRGPVFAHAATPDELLAALDDTTVVPAEETGEALPASGRVGGAGDVAALLWSASAARRSGTWTLLDDAGVRRTVALVAGRPTTIRSTAVEEQAAALLVRLGWCSPARIAAVEAGVGLPDTPVALCTALAQQGALLGHEQKPVARAVFSEQLAALVSVDSGAWQLRGVEPGEDPDGAGSNEPFEDADDCSVDGAVDDDGAFATLLAEAVRRRFDLHRLHAAVGGDGSILAPTRPPAPDEAEETPPWHGALLPDEHRVLASFDGERDIEAVAAAVGVHPRRVLQVAALGRVFGAVQVLRRAPAPGPDAIALQLAVARGLERERILDRLRRAREGDWFSLLSLAPDATTHAVRAAAAALRARFHPALAVERGVGDLRAALREINGAIDEAESILVDDEMRTAHRRRGRR
jgi:hypothetical protein